MYLLDQVISIVCNLGYTVFIQENLYWEQERFTLRTLFLPILWLIFFNIRMQIKKILTKWYQPVTPQSYVLGITLTNAMLDMRIQEVTHLYVQHFNMMLYISDGQLSGAAILSPLSINWITSFPFIPYRVQIRISLTSDSWVL